MLIFKIYILGDAQDIIDSDFEVKNVPLRNRADHGKYLCKFCPITQKHKRGFERKEDMKRHYHQHLNVSFISKSLSRRSAYKFFPRMKWHETLPVIEINVLRPVLF